MASSVVHKVLVVDDEEDILRGLRRAFVGHPVETCTTAEQALERLQKDSYAVVICDYALEGMNGLELVRRGKEHHPDTAFFMMTGYGTKELVVQALDSGLAGFFEKPLDLLAIQRKVNVHVERLEARERAQSEARFSLLWDLASRLDGVETDLLSLGHSGSDLREIKRSLATARGMTQYFPFLSGMLPVAQALEEVVGRLQPGDEMDADSLSLVLTAIDWMRGFVAGRREGERHPTDISALLQRLARCDPGRPPSDRLHSLVSGSSVAGTVGLVRSGPAALHVTGVELDALWSLVDELQETRSRVDKLLRYAATTWSESERELVQGIHDRLAEFSGRFQKSILRIRRVPLASVFAPLHLVARDSGQQANRHVSFETRDNDIAVDKEVGRRLFASLVHLVRNAIVHGVEEQPDRVENGKPPVGKVLVTASQAESAVFVTISDDGRGMDVREVLAQAIAGGRVDPESAGTLDEPEVFALLFVEDRAATALRQRGRPGLPTVAEHIRSIGGTVTLRSVPAGGTSVLLRIPAPTQAS